MIDWSASSWLEYGSVKAASVLLSREADGIEKRGTANLRDPREMTCAAASAIMNYWRRTVGNRMKFFGLFLRVRVGTPLHVGTRRSRGRCCFHVTPRLFRCSFHSRLKSQNSTPKRKIELQCLTRNCPPRLPKAMLPSSRVLFTTIQLNMKAQALASVTCDTILEKTKLTAARNIALQIGQRVRYELELALNHSLNLCSSW